MQVQFQFDVFGPRYSKIVPPVPQNYSLSGLARSSWVFNVRVRAKNCSGWSDWSGILSKVASFSDIPEPIDPSTIICKPGVGFIDLEWPEPVSCRTASLRKMCFNVGCRTAVEEPSISTG